jgi:hypothetical protein
MVIVNECQTMALDCFGHKKARKSLIYGLNLTALDFFEQLHGGSLNRMLRLTLIFKPI